MSDQSEQQNPFRSRRFILSLVVVGVIALCAVIVLVSNLFGGGNEEPTAAPELSSTAVTDADPSVCGLEGYETTSSLTSAPETTWRLVGTVAAPSDPDGSGPGETSAEGVPSCYAHTAQGALYAAANFVAAGTDANLGAKLIPLVAPGEGRAAAERLSGQASPDSSSNRAQIAGYKVSYEGNTATVDLVLNYSDGDLISLPIKMQWAEGDWKVVFTSEGQMPLAPAPLQSLGGYIPWSGA